MKKRSNKSGDNTMSSKEPGRRPRNFHVGENPLPPSGEAGGFEEAINALAEADGLTPDEWNLQHWEPVTETLQAGDESEGDNSKFGPSKELMADSLLLALIRAHKGDGRSELARLKTVTQAIYGREPEIHSVPDDRENNAVRHMVQLLHVDAVKAEEIKRQGKRKYKRLSIAKASTIAQEFYFPTADPSYAHSKQKRLQELYSGSDQNKAPRRKSAKRVNPKTHKRSLMMGFLLEDYTVESMVHQQLTKIAAILKPWGDLMKF